MMVRSPVGEASEDELKVLDVELGGDQLEGAAASRSSMKSPSMALSSPTGSKIDRFGGDLSLPDLVDRQTRLPESSSSVGLRPGASSGWPRTCICVMVSIMWTGTRMVQLLSAMARVIACTDPPGPRWRT